MAIERFAAQIDSVGELLVRVVEGHFLSLKRDYTDFRRGSLLCWQLGTSVRKKDGVLIIFSYLSELWLSQIKGYLNISHVYVHHVDTVHLRFQWKLTGRKFLSSTPKTCGTRNARSSGISLVIL